MARVHTTFGLLVAVVSFSACDLNPFGADDVCEGGSEQIKISDGNPPRFSWETDCRIIELLVYRQETLQTVWALGNVRGLGSPVTYAVVPRMATEKQLAEPLLPGETYLVYLWAPGEGSTQNQAGHGEFVAP